MENKNILQVDFEDIIKAKNPGLAKKLPRFVIKFAKKLIHEKEINEILEKANGAEGIDFVKVGIECMNLKSEIKGFENIPDNGRFIFTSNHPLGGLESLILMDTVNQKFSDFMFVVNDILMAVVPLRPLFIPINKHGKQSRENTELLNATYNSDKQILYFPAGLCSRKINGEIRDLKWQKSFISKSIEFQRDIIPIHIEGKNSNFFYNLANLRKSLKIKANLEMLFLVNEMFKQKGQTIKLTIGKPIPYTTFDKNKTNSEWAEWVKDKVYGLK